MATGERNRRLTDLKNMQLYDELREKDDGAKMVDDDLYQSAKYNNADDFLSILEKKKVPVSTIFEQVTPCGDSLLHVAAAATNPNNATEITELLATHFPDLIFRKNFQGDTPLHAAARTGHVPTAKALISQAKNSICFPLLLSLQNNRGNTALHEAVIHHHHEVINCLIDEDRDEAFTLQNRDDKSPLYLAVETCDVKMTNDVKTLECLLKAQPVDANSLSKLQKRSPAHAAVDKADQPVEPDSLSRQQKKSRANTTAEITNLVILQKIAELSPKLLRVRDGEGEIPLHHAVSKVNNTVIGKILIGKFRDGVIQPNQDGLYPIHVACKYDDVTMVELLLKEWSNPMDLLDKNGKNILHIAAEKGSEEVVKYILNYIDNNPTCKDLVNATDVDGNTPLHLAAKSGRSMVVFALVRNPLVRPHVYAVNGENLTSYEIAQKQSKTAEVKYAQDNPNKSTEVNINKEEKQTATTDSTKSQGSDEAKMQPTRGSKLDLYGIMMTLSILYFRARPKSSFVKNLRMKYKPLPKEELNNRIGTLLVVSVLVAGVTFAAALTVPAGAVTRGSFIAKEQDSIIKQVYIYFDMVALNASVMASLILCWAQLLNDVKIANLTVWLASILIGGSIYLMCLTFLFGLAIHASANLIFFIVIFVVQGLLFLGQTLLSVPLIIPPSANKAFERFFSPHIYYTMFHFHFVFQRILEALSRKHRAKHATHVAAEE